MLRRFATGAAVTVCFSTVALAADLGSLDWGDFRLAMDGGAKPKDVSAGTANNELTLSMTLDKLVANADGEKTEASASMEGEFVVGQPRTIALNSMKVELQGLIVKTPGTIAELTVKIGGMDKTFRWKADEVKSGRFMEQMTVSIPNGELPVPFPVSAIATVSRSKEAGAVLLSLDQIKVTIGQNRVADFSWGTFKSLDAFEILPYAKSAAVEDRSGHQIQ
jgi:hypothetical protein